MDKIIIAIIPAIAVIIDAYTDKIDILNVKHLRGVVIYAVAVAFPYSFFIQSTSILSLILIPILTRAALFDIALNLMTGNSFTYNGDSSNPHRSIIDKLEDKTGFSIFTLRIIYLTIYIGYLIYFFIHQ